MQLKIKISSPHRESSDLTFVNIASNGNMIDELRTLVKTISDHSPDISIRVTHLDHETHTATRIFYSKDMQEHREA